MGLGCCPGYVQPFAVASLDFVAAFNDTSECVERRLFGAVRQQARVGAVEDKLAQAVIAEIGFLAFELAEEILVEGNDVNAL